MTNELGRDRTSRRMRLSTIFELLLILLLVAFAAYGRVIDPNEAKHRAVRAVNGAKRSDIGLSTMSLKQATDSVNRYCTCNENICNCCRDFHIPVVQLKGPGCASLQYLQGDNLAVQLSFGENILTSTIVNGRSPKPVCVPLPGGFTKFCGRIYSIKRDAKNHFKACLGLELQSATELEASLRVSCFRFGPEGLKLRPAEPLPVVEAESTEEDDDDDFFGLDTDDDDEDDDDDDRPSPNSVPDTSDAEGGPEGEDDDEEDDILGLGALLDIFTGDDDSTTKRPRVTTPAPLLEFTIPILTRPTTPTPLETYELTTSGDNVSFEESNEEEDNTQEPLKTDEEEDTESAVSNQDDITGQEDQEDEITEASNKVTYIAKPDKVVPNNVKKGVTAVKKKPTVTSTSINAIDEPVKPAKKPIKDEEDEDDEEDDDDDEDDDILDDEEDEAFDDEDKDDEDEDEEDEDKLDDEKYEEQDDDDEDEKAEDIDLVDLDDDDEEEDEVLSALMGGRKNKKNKMPGETHINENHGLKSAAKDRRPSGSRQSRIMRF